MVSNMKELCAYVKAKNRERAHQHYEMAKVHGECTGMGQKWYKLPQKSSYPKQHKAAYNKIWR
tara:strand:+ start:137 stop:325 length:189 start_codon:yes stop_codon:yes gene_type:complete